MSPTPSDSPETRVRQARAARCLELLLLVALSWQLGRGCLRLLSRTADGPAPAPVIVDLMRDPAWRVALLPGIGDARALAILRDRRRDPPYAYLEDLTRIRGIGPGTLRRIADTQTVRVWLDGQPVRWRDAPPR